jgi:predicted metal-binding membrane protein
MSSPATLQSSVPVAPALRASRPLGIALIATLLFAGTAAYTIYCTRAMGAGMNMPGGWTMSMMWMPMPGQSLAASAAMFIAMWTAMMVAMMLPSAMPMILVYRRVTVFHGISDSSPRTALVAADYFAVWGAFGIGVFAGGALWARAAMSWPAFSRAVPAVSAACLILSGLYQLTPWKSSCLKHCRDPLTVLADHLHGGRLGALQLGLHHGGFCALCCSSLMLIQIVLGMMNLVVMTLIASVIALEKILPGGVLIARLVGLLAIAAGAYMLR